MGDKGRGRSRGRARGTDPEHISQTQPTGPPQQSAWGRRPGQPQAPAQTPYARPQLSGAGRSTQRLEERATAGPSRPPAEPSEFAHAGGGDAPTAGRGAMRGRRSLPSDILVTKPKHIQSKRGSSGTHVKLQANYFKLLATTDWCLYKYRVDFAPEEDRTVVRKGLLRLHKETLGAYIFDGTVMYTSKRLPDKLELFSVRTSDEARIRIDIKLVSDMVKGDYHYLQFFNIIMRKCLSHLHLQMVGRNYFDALSKVEVKEFGLELWPGYLTSIRQHEYDILMCAEITHKVMRQQTLLDILQECHRTGRDFMQRYAAEVIGMVVLTDYNNNTYRVDDVDFSVSPRSTFERKGESISYADYYRTRYDIRIRNETQPLLVSRSKPRDRRAGKAELVYLVPELCRATGITDEMRKSFQLMRAVDEHTRVKPEMRIRKLLQFNERLRSDPNIMREFTDWNLKLDQHLVEIPGRILPPEDILFGGNAKASAGQDVDWTKEFRNKALLNCRGLKDWVLICTDRIKRDAQGFVNTLSRAASGMRFQIDSPRVIDIRDDRSGTYTECLEYVMSKYNPELVFCIVPNNRADRYSAIKKKCCVDRPVPSQVFLQKNLASKGVMSIATKVAIQMNCKLGGAAWTVHIPVSNLMVVGFDVCHDTNTKGRDFGAMVASLDKYLTRYYSAVSAHTTGEELSNDLALNLCKALHKFRELNNTLPNRILIYRDGVGEGQVPYVIEHEIKHIREKVGQLYGSPDAVHMAFILVTKRINTRLFINRSNPKPGTVVDDIITNPVKYDFFIVSQTVRQGTVSPTAYSVLDDNVGLEPDQIQILTYKLTHLYFNCSATVRVPAPCQYAHKLAFLVAQAIHRPPSTQLESLLYYL